MPFKEYTPRLCKNEPVRGIIKSVPEDFVVKEITQEGTILEPGKRYERNDEAGGAFTRFVLQKKGWNTTQALKAVAAAHGRGIRSVGFAGTKDRQSISVQLCSIFKSDPEEVINTSIKDISINGAWRSSEAVKLGDLIGNRFAIRIRGASDRSRLEAVDEELDGLFPNYYGNQRFGYRDNNVDIGLALLKGDYRSAVLKYLTESANEKLEEGINARKRLADELDFQEALSYFPHYLKYERSVIEYLSRFPGEYLKAFRRIPRHLSLMFVHSVESHIFNRELAGRVTSGELSPSNGDYVCGKNPYGFPDTDKVEVFGSTQRGGFATGNIVGYGTERLTESEKEIMDELGVSQSMFKLKGFPELSSKGAFRPFFAPYLGFSISESEDADSVIEFSLPHGSYATVLLREFMDNVTGGTD